MQSQRLNNWGLILFIFILWVQSNNAISSSDQINTPNAASFSDKFIYNIMLKMLEIESKFVILQEKIKYSGMTSNEQGIVWNAEYFGEDKFRSLTYWYVFDVGLEIERTKYLTESLPKLQDREDIYSFADRLVADSFKKYEARDFFYDINYSRDNLRYEMYFLIKHKAEGASNYSVAKIVDGRIYWKDDFAECGRKISDLDWDKVDYLIADLTVMDDDMHVKWIGSPAFPDYIP